MVHKWVLQSIDAQLNRLQSIKPYLRK